MEEQQVNSPAKDPGRKPRTGRRSVLVRSVLSGLLVLYPRFTEVHSGLAMFCSGWTHHLGWFHAMLGCIQILCVGFGVLLMFSAVSTNGAPPQPFGIKSETPSSEIIRLEMLPGNTDRPVVTAMELSPDGRFLAAAGDDHAVRLLDLGHTKVDVPSMSFAAARVSSNESSGSEHLGNTSIQELEPVSRHTWQSHSDWVRSVRFSPSGRLVASCGNDGKIVIYDVAAKHTIASSHVTHALHDLCFVDDTVLYAVGFHTNVYRWDLSQADPIVDHQADCHDLRSIQYSPSSRCWRMVDETVYCGFTGCSTVGPNCTLWHPHTFNESDRCIFCLINKPCSPSVKIGV